MKKVLIITNVITLGFLLCTWAVGCDEPGTKNEPDNPNNSKCETCTQTPNGKFDFDGEDAIKLVANYTSNHWLAINNANSGNIKDSRSVWISLSRLKGFIKAIEDSATSKLSGCCCDLGVRIYLAQYDEALVDKFKNATANDPIKANRFNPKNENYANKTTAILIPTYTWDNGTIHDFNPLDGVTCGSLQPESTWHKPILALAMNHGSIIPPPFPSKHCPDYMASGADFMVYGVDVVPTSSNGPSPNPYFEWTATQMAPATCQD